MNNDSNLSIINCQSIFENIDKREFDELKKLTNHLSELINWKKSELNNENIKSLIGKANKFIATNKNRRDNEEIIKIKNKIKKIASP